MESTPFEMMTRIGAHLAAGTSADEHDRLMRMAENNEIRLN